MMGSARWEPTGVAGLGRHRRRLGFSPMPVLPILPSVDHSHCSSREEASSPYLEIFSGYGSRFVLAPVAPYSPDDSSDLVGQRDCCLIHPSVLLHLESPGSQPVGMLQPFGSDEHRSRSMDQERTQIDIALLADAPESALRSAGVLLWSQAKEAGKLTASRETQNLADKGDEGGGRYQPDTRNRHQVLNHRHAGCQSAQLALDGFHALLEISDLKASFSERQAQGIGNGAISILDQCPDLGHDVVSTDWDRQAEFPQDATHGVDASGAVADPGGAQPMQGGQCLLRDRLDWNGMDLFVAMGFEQALGVGAVGLVAPYIRLDVGRGQQQDLMTEFAELSSPMMCHAAGLEEDDGGLALGKEGQELLSGKPMGLCDLARVVRDRDLEHVLCQIDSDCGRFSHGLLLSVLQTTRDYGTKAGVAGGVHPITEPPQRWPARSSWISKV
jgi:hypothetical protein